MLRDICRVVENDEDFVGLRFVDGHPEVLFPRGFALSYSDGEIRQDVIRLLSTIQRFSDHHEGDKNMQRKGDADCKFPIQSYQYVIFDYLQNGYYSEREVRYIESQRGKINWKRTIQMEQPHLDSDNIVYLNFIIKSNLINTNTLLTRIHEYCVYESFLKMGWLYLDSDDLPMKPRLPLHKDVFLSTLTKELGQTFNNNKKRLLKSMINIINESSEETNKDSTPSFGVHRFEYVWEAMIDYVFGEDNREQYYPKAQWHIISKNGLRTESSELRPDTIMKYDGKVFILDAKYYKFGITGLSKHLPNTDSIQKQITYGDYVVQQAFASPNDVYNAFLMPFCRENDMDPPYKFVSVGTADWRQYGPKTENHNYVLGLLVDTRFLVSTCTKHNIDEIQRLSSCIEKSLEYYRQAK